MKNLSKHLVAGSLLFSLASVASAGDIRIDVGTDWNTDTDSVTADFEALGFTGTLATSIYQGLTPGSQVFDTNIASVMDSFGFMTGDLPTLDGGNPLSAGGHDPFSYASVGEKNIDALNPLVGGFGGGDDVEGFNLNWNLTFDYYLEGTVTATGVDYTSGYFDLFHNDLGGSTQVARLEVTGSSLFLGDLVVQGNVTYDFDGDGIDDASPLAQGFFVDSTTGDRFYDRWLAGTGADVSFRLDTNVNPPIPTADQLVPLANDDGVWLFRQTTLAGEVSFQVPAPGVLALMGFGLLSLGLSSRRRKAA